MVFTQIRVSNFDLPPNFTQIGSSSSIHAGKITQNMKITEMERQFFTIIHHKDYDIKAFFLQSFLWMSGKTREVTKKKEKENRKFGLKW